jgi:hypothetical protein
VAGIFKINDFAKKQERGCLICQEETEEVLSEKVPVQGVGLDIVAVMNHQDLPKAEVWA